MAELCSRHGRTGCRERRWLKVMSMKNYSSISRQFSVVVFFVFTYLANVFLCVRECVVKFNTFVVNINRFTGSVKLKGVVVIGGEDEYHPKELRL